MSAPLPTRTNQQPARKLRKECMRGERGREKQRSAEARAYLVDLVRVGTIDLDRVRGQLGVEPERVVQMLRDELRVDLPLREHPDPRTRPHRECQPLERRGVEEEV